MRFQHWAGKRTTQRETQMTSARQTTDHDAIRQWIEARQGRPSRVRDTGSGGILRIDFGDQEEDLEPVEWEEFFRIFEESELAFLHQDRTESEALSRFNKFVSRN
jgi:hypothetical protein